MHSNKRSTIITIIIFLVLITLPLFFYFKHKRNQAKYIPPAPREEIDITIIPGWDLRKVVADWKKKDLIKSEDELYKILGKPAYNYVAFKKTAPKLNLTDDWGKELYPLLSTRPDYVSYEGYLFPDTYRIYKDAKLHEILKKIFTNLEDKITNEMRLEMNVQKRNLFQVLIMASLVEREAQADKDMKIVADIFSRRLNKNWALQSCASVNYVTKKNVPAISAEDQKIDSPYNTYKYPGLPLGPIGNPSLTAIKSVLYPTKNSYWYFMTGNDGEMRYATTLDEHNMNVWKYLR